MASHPKVSVIVPCYNIEKYLRQCMDSIICQTLQDIEIICVNDGSTDNTPAILEEYAKKDSRIQILHTKNQFAGTARNEGMKIATGEYYSFLDADDVFEPDLLEKLFKQATKTNADICVCRADMLFADNKIKKMNWSLNTGLLNQNSTFAPSEIAEHIFQFCAGWPWDKLFKACFIKEHQLQFQSLHHSNDTFFVLMSLCLAQKITCINDILVHYRQHSQSLAHNTTLHLDCFALALKKLCDELLKNNLYKQYEKSFIKYIYSFSNWHKSKMKTKAAQQQIKAIADSLIKDIEASTQTELFKKIQLDKIKFLGIRFYTYVEEYNKKKWKILGITALKRKQNDTNTKIKYFFFGLPILKIQEKG